MADRFFIWDIGCQMNHADARRAGAELERLGMEPAARPEDADLVLVNSCVVRQSAEDKVTGRLGLLRRMKKQRPGLAVVLMGCLVGDIGELRARFPHVDLFVKPSDVQGLVEWVKARSIGTEERVAGVGSTLTLALPLRRGREPQVPGTLPLPFPPPPQGEGQGEGGSGTRQGLPCEDAPHSFTHSGAAPVSAEVAAMMGCDRHCTYCLVRLRRGPAQSRPMAEVVAECEELVRSGVREIVLLGQNIDVYGRDLDSAEATPPTIGAAVPFGQNIDVYGRDLAVTGGRDLPQRPTLAGLLRRVHGIPGLLRLRFLTSHPADLEDEVLTAVEELPKLCPHWELPVQAGDDEVLRRMGRGHTAAQYLELVERIRARLPRECSIATDVIVGFPGETAAQFEHTLDLLRAARLDAVHVACYSVRPGTPAARLTDDVPQEEKERRHHAVEELQEQIVGEINARLLGNTVEVLVEGQHKGRWRGRTRTNKLVFFDSPEDWTGRLAQVRITKAGPWSLGGELA